MENFRIATIEDIIEMEKTPIEERLYAFNTYDLFRKAASIETDSMGIESIFMSCGAVLRFDAHLGRAFSSQKKYYKPVNKRRDV